MVSAGMVQDSLAPSGRKMFWMTVSQGITSFSLGLYSRGSLSRKRDGLKGQENPAQGRARMRDALGKRRSKIIRLERAGEASVCHLV